MLNWRCSDHSSGEILLSSCFNFSFFQIESSEQNKAKQNNPQTHHFIKIWLMYKKLYLLNILSLMNLEINGHPQNHHQNLYHKSVHHPQKCPSTFFTICICDENIYRKIQCIVVNCSTMSYSTSVNTCSSFITKILCLLTNMSQFSLPQILGTFCIPLYFCI
jgi:hypothetical protein